MLANRVPKQLHLFNLPPILYNVPMTHILTNTWYFLAFKKLLAIMVCAQLCHIVSSAFFCSLLKRTHMLISQLDIHFRELPVQVFFPFFYRVVCLFMLMWDSFIQSTHELFVNYIFQLSSPTLFYTFSLSSWYLQ